MYVNNYHKYFEDIKELNENLVKSLDSALSICQISLANRARLSKHNVSSLMIRWEVLLNIHAGKSSVKDFTHLNHHG